MGVHSPLTTRDLPRDEADFSTEQPQAAEDTRLPGADANDGRPERAEAPTAARPSPTRRLKRGPTKARFEQIFKTGKRVSGTFCRLSAIPGEGLVGIATSRKLGAHPQRNRGKRRFREALRAEITSLEERLDYVLVILPAGAEAPYDAIREDLRTVFQKMGERWESELESS